MILENHEDYFVIDSSSIGLLQHDPYTWKVEDGSFVSREEVYKSRQFMNEALNEWILKLDDEQLEVFVGTLFHVLEGCESKNLIELAGDWKKSILGMMRASKDVSHEAKDEIQEIMLLFFETIKDNLKKL